MKLYALYSDTGEILAAVPLDAPASRQDAVPVPRPVARAGQYAREFMVPREFSHLTLYELCTRLKVDMRAEQHALVLDNAGASSPSGG